MRYGFVVLAAALLTLAVLALLPFAKIVQPAQAQPTLIQAGFRFSLPPDRIVNLIGVETVGPSSASTLYTVPETDWLIITDVGFKSDGTRALEIIEDLAGAEVSKFSRDMVEYAFDALDGNSTGSAFSSAVGQVFRPGSTVRVKNHSGVPKANWQYYMTGYLVPR